MRFIKKDGRAIPIRDSNDAFDAVKPAPRIPRKRVALESRIRTIGRKTVSGAKLGVGLGVTGVLSHHLSELAITGATHGTWKNVGRGIGYGALGGVAFGSINGILAKRRKAR